jgi:hypothetical protein
MSAAINVDLFCVDNTRFREKKKQRSTDKSENGEETTKSYQKPPSTDVLVDIIVAPSIIGRKPDAFLDETTQLCEDPTSIDKNGNAKQWYRCKGIYTSTEPHCHCRQVWASPRTRDRVFRHVARCHGFSLSQRAKADSLLSKGAPGAMADVIQSRELEEVAGTSGKPRDGNLVAIWNRRSDKEYLIVVEAAVVKLFCGLGLAPSKADTFWWKEFMAAVSCGRVDPVSGTTLAESHIAREAANVRQLTLEHLCSEKVVWITYGFDAGGTRRRNSFLTIHATDDSKRAHFLAAVDTSGKTHSGQLYADLVLDASYFNISEVILQ